MTVDVGADESQSVAADGRNAEGNARPLPAQSRASEDRDGFEFRFEFERTMANLGTDPRLARQLLLNFHARHAESPQSIRAAVDAGGWDQAQSIVHNLKGTAGTVGFHAISAVAEQLETALKAQSGGDLQGLLTQLEQTCKPVFDELSSLTRPAPTDTSAHRPTLSDNALLSALNDLQLRLDSMDPDTGEALERLLPSLQARDLSAHTAALQSALVQFDFQGAEAHLQSLRERLGGDP